MRAWADLCGCVYMTVFLCLRVRVNLLSEQFRLSNKITRKQIRALSAFYYSREEHDKKTDYWQELGGSRQEGSGAGVGGYSLLPWLRHTTQPMASMSCSMAGQEEGR